MQLRIVPHYSAAASQHAAAFTHLRLVLRDSATSQVLADTTIAVSSTDPHWNVALNVTLPEREGPITAVLSVELLNGSVVEYSDVVTLQLSPGARSVDVTPVPGPPENRSVTAIRIDDAAAPVREGDSVQLGVELEGATSEVRVFWRSLEADIADVDENGVVDALLPGMARIVASVGHIEDTLQLAVRQRAVRVVLEPASIVVDRITGEAVFTAQVVDARGSMVEGSAILWSSADPTVATSLGEGRFRAGARGRSDVHATSRDEPGLSATATLIVQPAAVRGELDATSLTFASLGESSILAASFFDAADQPVTGVEIMWSSSAPAVASIDADGRVTAHANGVADISATVDGVTVTAAVTVAQIAAHVTLTPTSLTLMSGESHALAAAAHDANGHVVANALLEWSSSEDDVASVDDDGIVTAHEAGSATITVSSGEAEAAADVTVEPGDPAELVVVSGGDQQAAAGTALPAPVVIQVLNALGLPLGGVSVSWTPSAGAVTADAVTDDDGMARASWTLGPVAGPQTLGVDAGRLSVTLDATALPGAAARVVITPSTLTLHAIGESGQLQGAVTDALGNAVNTPLAWRSANAAVATVDETGAVTATGNGTVDIVATAGAASASVSVTVQQRTATLAVTPEAVTVRAGENTSLTAVVRDARGHVITDADVEWSSSAPATATVDADGVVSGLRTGSAVITATSGDASATSVVTVQAGAPAMLEIIGGDGQTEQVARPLPEPLAVRVHDSLGNPVAGAAVTWSVSGGSLDAQTVSDDAGVASAQWTLGPQPGTQIVTAAVGALSVSFTATARAGAPASVLVTPSAVMLETLGATAALSATVTDALGNVLPPNVTWRSADASIASVSDAGLVTAAANGTVQITATAGAASAVVTVTVAQRAASLTLTPDAFTLRPGETAPLTATVFDAGGHVIADAVITWSSSAIATATVDDAGVVSGEQVGSAVITAAHADVSATTSVDVVVPQAQVLEIVSGNTQHGTVATALPQPLVVRVTDADGYAVPGATVLFSGSGSFTEAVTNADGVAQATWTLGTTAGAQSATAAIGELTADFTATAAAGAAANVVVTPSSVLLESIGATQTLSAVVTDAHGNATSESVTWSSADADVATVTEDGVVTAVANGEVLVTATAGTASAAVTVTVAQRAASLTLTPNAITLRPGETAPLTAAVYDAGGHVIADAVITWSSDAPETAAVDEAGVVSGGQVGSAVITAAHGDVSATTSVDVVVPQAEVLEIVSGNAQHGTVATALPEPLVVRVTDADGYAVPGATVLFSGSGSFTEAVTDADGVAQTTWTLGTTAGAQAATAAIGELTADFTATAAAGAAANVVVTPSSVLLESIGATQTLSAVVTDAHGNATSESVTWSSADADVATVSEDGVVTAVANGEVLVTATAGAASTAVTVTVAQRAASLTLTPSALALRPGETAPLTAAVFDAGGHVIADAVITWSSDAPQTAAVDEAGVVSGEQVGSAVITAAHGDVSATTSVDVVVPQAEVLETVSGNAQHGTVATALPEPLVVRVTDADGYAVPGATVLFSGSGSFTEAVTNADGVAQTTWTLGTAAGAQSATAAIGELTAEFTATAAAGPAANVVVTPSSVLLESIGATQTLSAVVTDAHGNAASEPVTLSSADADVATVTEDGVVTAVANGEVLITATVGTASAAVTVTVAQRAASLTLTPSALALRPGETAPLTAAVFDAGGHVIADAVITWSSDAPETAGVDEAGVVSGEQLGSAVITATHGDVSATTSVDVVVPQAQVLEIVSGNAQHGTIATALPEPLVVRVTDADGYAVPGATVLFSGSGSFTEAVTNADGVAQTAWTLGTTAGAQAATAAIGELTADFTATAAAGPAANVVVTPSSVLLESIGATQTLSAVVTDAHGNAASETVTWSSADADVATVSEDGVVSAVANGEVLVTATAGTASAAVTVTVTQRAASVVIDPPVSSFINALTYTRQLTATAYDANGHPLPAGSVSWTSSSAHASVDSDGLVTAVSVGQAVITAAAGEASHTEVITVRQVTAAVDIPQDELALLVGMSASLTAFVRDSAGHDIPDAAVEWTNITDGIVGLDGAVVTALVPGTARIRASHGGEEDFVDVHVTLADGVTHVWLGGISDDWSVPGNWSPSSVPDAESVVQIGETENLPRLSSAAAVGALHLDAGATIDLNQLTLTTTQSLAIDGSIMNGVVVLAGAGQPVRGALPDVSVSGTAFASGPLTIGQLSLNQGGELDVRAEQVVVTGSATGNGGTLRMDDQGGVLQIDGNLALNAGVAVSSLTAGELRLGGDLQAAGSAYAPSLSHTTILQGIRQQTVAVDGGHLQHVVFANPIGVALLDGELEIRGTAAITDGAGAVTGAETNVTLMTSLSDATGDAWQVANTTIGAGTVTLPASMKTNLHVALSWTAAAPLSLDGSLFVTGAEGDVILNGNRITVSGDLTGDQGIFTMLHADDVLDVRGNVTLEHGNTISRLTAGELRIGGDFSVLFNNPPAFAPDGSHTVVMDGTGAQSITTQFPANATDKRFFNNLEIRNDSEEGVTFDSGMPVNGSLAVYGTLRIPADRTVEVIGVLHMFAGSKLYNAGILRVGSLGSMLGQIIGIGPILF